MQQGTVSHGEPHLPLLCQLKSLDLFKDSHGSRQTDVKLLFSLRQSRSLMMPGSSPSRASVFLSTCRASDILVSKKAGWDEKHIEGVRRKQNLGSSNSFKKTAIERKKRERMLDERPCSIMGEFALVVKMGKACVEAKKRELRDPVFP